MLTSCLATMTCSCPSSFGLVAGGRRRRILGSARAGVFYRATSIEPRQPATISLSFDNTHWARCDDVMDKPGRIFSETLHEAGTSPGEPSPARLQEAHHAGECK